MQFLGILQRERPSEFSVCYAAAERIALRASDILLKLGNRLSAPTGTQAVDASRFHNTFGLRPKRDVESVVLECGASYVRIGK